MKFKTGDAVAIFSNGFYGIIIEINFENKNPYFIENENGVKAWYGKNEIYN